MLEGTTECLSYVTDISMRKREEESLRASEGQYRALFEQAPFPKFLFDLKTLRFLAVNDAAIKHYGFSREQFLAMDAYEIRPAEDRQRLRQFVETGSGDFADGQSRRHVNADGTAIDVVIFSAKLTYQGRPAWLGAAIDITERNRAEARVRDTQEFLDTIVENVPVSIIVKDADDFRYVLVNRSTEQLLGIGRDALLGKTVVDTVAVRAGDALTALVVWAGSRAALSTQAFATLNLVLITVWIVVVFSIGRENARRAAESEEQIAAEPVAA